MGIVVVVGVGVLADYQRTHRWNGKADSGKGGAQQYPNLGPEVGL